MSKAEDFRAKAVAAELAAQRATDPAVRTSYQELARGWFELARNADWLVRGGSGQVPPETEG
jgi:hypothetical protein